MGWRGTVYWMGDLVCGEHAGISLEHACAHFELTRLDWFVFPCRLDLEKAEMNPYDQI